MVLATDFSKHFEKVGHLNNRISSPDFDIKEKDKFQVMDFLIHSADISNPAKKWKLCKTWAVKCINEFWNQGDMERKKGLPISFLMDRYTTNIAKSQNGFINVFVIPTFKIVIKILPKTKETVENAENNLKEWKKLEEHYQDELGKLYYFPSNETKIILKKSNLRKNSEG